MTDANRTHTRTPRTKLRLGRRCALAATALGLLALPHAASAQLEDPGRKAPAGCMSVVVQKGDTTWAIATANGLTLDQIARLNPQIPDLSRIHPGDELAVTCSPDGVALAVPQSVTRGVDVSRWLDERETDGRLTWRSVVAHLYAAGLRGDALAELAGTAECESNRWPTAVGDVHLADKKWGPSIGVWQVRTLHAQRGTGGPRDEAALRGDVDAQARAAVEVWRSQGGRAWTCWRNRHHVGQLGHVRQALVEIGVA